MANTPGNRTLATTAPNTLKIRNDVQSWAGGVGGRGLSFRC